MKKLKIMWLHSHFSLPSGGVKYVLEAIRELSKNHDVDLYVQKALPKFEKQFKDAGINITIMSRHSTGDVFFWLNFSRQINKEIEFLKNRVKNYDLVISSIFPMNIEANSLNLPHLQSCFQPFAFFWDPDMISNLPFWERIFVKFLKSHFSKYDLEFTKKSNIISTVISDIQYWIQKVYERDSFVAHAGVDTDFFKKTENIELQKKYAGKKIILHSTDWTPLKRTNWLIDQFIDIFSKSEDAILLITEIKIHGSERKSAIKKIKDNKISNIELCGLIPEDLLPAYYSLADVTVYCGVGEGAGSASYVVLESLSCETPVIRTNLTRDEVEHGKTGFLYEKNDITNFKKYLIELLNNNTLSMQFGKEGREFIIKNRSWKKFVEIWEQNIVKILR